MTRSLVILYCSAGLLFAGCKADPYELSAQDKAAFKGAIPEARQLWEKALTADKANDYLTASTGFRTLLNREITPEQLLVVQTALGGLNYRINAAAAKGDAAAQNVLNSAKDSASRR